MIQIPLIKLFARYIEGREATKALVFNFLTYIPYVKCKNDIELTK